MKRTLISILLYCLLNGTFIFGQEYGNWRSIDSMKEARYNHSSIQLANGNVLVVGGAVMGDQKSCEIFDTSLNGWSEAANTNYVRGRHRLVMLDSKRILAVGSPETNSCEIYDPDSNKWTLTDSLKIRRILAQHQAVKLFDGRVLVIGGYTNNYTNANEQTLKLVEVYDETTGKWSVVDSLNARRATHTATLLKDGRVLVVGGTSYIAPLATCEIYEPIQNRWSESAPMNIARKYHKAVLLPNGNVLVMGGYAQNNLFQTKSCELYDPIQDRWKIVDSLQTSDSEAVFVINDRNLLVIGTDYYQNIVWEIYDYIELKSKYLGYVNGGSFWNNKIQLGDGRVLVSGGARTSDYEVYLPTNRSWIFEKNPTHVSESNNGVNEDIFFQNYPNPFNCITTIKFFISKTSDVKISIYNNLGEKVQELIDEKKEQGFHEILFTHSNLSSGIYYCHITINKKGVTKKLLLLK